MTTNIATATNLVYAAPRHHGWEASAYSGLAAVDIFVVDTIVLCLHHKLKSEVVQNSIHHLGCDFL